jgi:hypothetical protein
MFMTLYLHRFATSRLHKFMIPDLHRFATSGLRRFKIPDLHRFTTSGLRRFKIPNLHRFNHPENLFHEFRQTRRFDLRGWRFFPEFPNTSPSGKQVDSDDPIPRKLLNFSKKPHPRNVGVDTRPLETSQRSNRGGFLKLPLSPL